MKKWLVWLLIVELLLGICSIAEAKGGEIVKIGGDIVVREGMKLNNAVTIGGHITVNGEIEGEVVAIGGSVTLGPKAAVSGNVVSLGGAIEKDEDAEVHGELVEINIPGISSIATAVSRVNWRASFRTFRIITFIGFLALALLIVAIMPKSVGKISAMIEDNVVKTSLWGLLGIVLVVPLAVLLAVSVVGTVLIPLEIILVICALLIGYIAVAQLIGKNIIAALKKSGQPVLWTTFWGLIILQMVGLIPIFGWLVKVVVLLLGLGGVIANLVNTSREQRAGG